MLGLLGQQLFWPCFFFIWSLYCGSVDVNPRLITSLIRLRLDGKKICLPDSDSVHQVRWSYLINLLGFQYKRQLKYLKRVLNRFLVDDM